MKKHIENTTVETVENTTVETVENTTVETVENTTVDPVEAVLLEALDKAVKAVNNAPATITKAENERLEKAVSDCLAKINEHNNVILWDDCDNLNDCLALRVFIRKVKREKNGLTLHGEYTDTSVFGWFTYRRDNFMTIANGKQLATDMKAYASELQLLAERDIMTGNGGSNGNVQKALQAVFDNQNSTVKINREDVRFINDTVNRPGKASNTLAKQKLAAVYDSLHRPFNRVMRGEAYRIEKKEKSAK